MIDFKIIAIKPLKDCNPRLRKITKEDTLYYFYKGYTIANNKIDWDGTNSDFYNIDDINVNICAVVGKNGSGKSSLVDLLIAAINNLSCALKLNSSAELESITDLKLELYFKTNRYYKIIFNSELLLYQQDDLSNGFQPVDLSELKSDKFFYSIVVNYSHFGLNSKEIGEWIDGLFHKNDGYQIPIVLSPLRKEGNIDINKEKELTHYRLMSNLLVSGNDTDGQIHLTDTTIAHEIEMQLQQHTNSAVYKYEEVSKSYDNEHGTKEVTLKHAPLLHELNVDGEYILSEVDKIYPFKYSGQWETGDHVLNLAHHYIIKKLVKIAVTYPFYNEYFDKKEKNFVQGKFHEYLTLLFQINSNHISFKLKQTLNFIKFKHIEVRDHRPFTINLVELSKRIKKILKDNALQQDEIINLLPPPILKPRIVLQSTLGTKNKILFEDLSAGEKQLTLATNSILYHLFNLDSIIHSDIQVGYKFINIILDEFELNMHPDMQRELVNFIIQRIREKKFKNINAINLIIITHSPFILSDIPHSNTLFLDKFGYPNKHAEEFKTFGANIHDLLKNSFFLEKGPIGEYAKTCINEAIEFLNYKRIELEVKKLESLNDRQYFKLIKLRKEELEDIKKRINVIDKDKHVKIIEKIGEPILSKKLSDMYKIIFNSNMTHQTT